MLTKTYKKHHLFKQRIIDLKNKFPIELSTLKKKRPDKKMDRPIKSFRHTGSIQLCERDKDILKLKKTLNHSRVQVTVGYLRGLEVNNLSEADMPDLL